MIGAPSAILQTPDILLYSTTSIDLTTMMNSTHTYPYSGCAKRRIFAGLSILLLISLCPGVRAQAEPSGAEVGKPSVLFLGNDSLPPMNFMQGGKPVGIVVDLARAIAERMPSHVDIQLTEWAEAQQLVLEDRADALLQINPSPERLQLYDFSEPLLTSEFAIFIPSERMGIACKDDLRGLRVGVEAKGLPVLLLRQDPKIDVRTVSDIVQGFRMLATGAVDAVVADRWAGSYVLAEYRIEGLRSIAEPIERSHSAIAVKKGNTNLLYQINAALAEIRSNGTYDRIVEAWRPKEVVFKTREQLRRQSWLIAAIAMALVAALASVAALVWEVRRRRRAETALRESEAKYRNLFANMAEEVHFWKLVRDEAGQIQTWRLVDANPPTLKTWGRRTVEEIRGKTTDEIFGPRATEHYLSIVRKIMTEGVPYSFEDYFPHLDRYFRFTSVPLGEYFITTGADITSIKKTEAALRASLNEKEILLKEVHHRVKNNMQILASLVSLQADNVVDPATRDVFNDFRDQVRAMALVHENLYQSETLASIDFADYAGRLTTSLARAYAQRGGDIRLSLTAEPVTLPIESAIPCGLILNELVTNAYKHAFRERVSGEIVVGLHCDPSGCVCLSVCDNGVGLPPGMDWRHSTSLGLRLVQMLARQVEGEIDLSTEKGTSFQLKFTLPPPKEPEREQQA